MIWLFLLAVGFCVYTYAIFPICLHVLARRVSEPTPPELSSFPAVSIVIAAHNEQENLPAKLKSLQALDYPENKLQIVIVSDGSTDKSIEILNAAQSTLPHLHIVEYAPAAGKPTALNRGVAEASGSVLVFMDARQSVSSNALKALIARLQQDDVGVVSGELCLTNDDGLESANVGLYWRYEKWIRLNESRLFSTTGATGALYAMHKSDFIPHKDDVLLDDFDTPVSVLLKGKRTVFEPEARVFDKTEASASGEFQRKSRTLAGNFQSFARNKWLFNPAKNPVFVQFLSHKVFRLLVPYAMAIAFISAALGTGPFLKLMLILQLAFYGAGIATILGVPALNNKVFNFIKVFLQLNAAAVAGAFRFITGSSNVRWKQS